MVDTLWSSPSTIFFEKAGFLRLRSTSKNLNSKFPLSTRFLTLTGSILGIHFVKGHRSRVMAVAVGPPLNKQKGILVYGASGHTGNLIAEKLNERGITATLAGRNEEKIKRVSERNGDLPFEVFSLNDTTMLDKVVSEHAVVLHVAGPFTTTGPPMIESCLKNGVHYLDLTGEAQFVKWVASLDAEATAKGVMLMCAVGFDVIPGDCLGSYLKHKLPTATDLDVAVFIVRSGGESKSSASRGTLLSALLHIFPNGGLVCRNGKLIKEAIAKRSRLFSVLPDEAPTQTFSFPAAECVTLLKSAAIPNTTVYFPSTNVAMARAFGFFAWVFLRWSFVRSFVKSLVNRFYPQPVEQKGSSTRMLATGEARDSNTGASVRASIKVGPGYPFTASSSVEIAARVLNGQFKPGFQTPASVFGYNLVKEIPSEEVEIIDLH